MNNRYGGHVGNERGAFDRPNSQIPPIDGDRMEHLGLGSDVAGDGKFTSLNACQDADCDYKSKDCLYEFSSD